MANFLASDKALKTPLDQNHSSHYQQLNRSLLLNKLLQLKCLLVLLLLHDRMRVHDLRAKCLKSYRP